MWGIGGAGLHPAQTGWKPVLPRLRTLKGDQRGQALPIVLMMLVLGVFFVTPAVTYANVGLIALRNNKETAVNQFTADSGIALVVSKLLSSTYADAPPSSESFSINGSTVAVTITPVTAPTIIDQEYSLNVNNKSIKTTEEFWLVMSNNPSGGAGTIYMAYDTKNFPARIEVPWVNAGRTTYYLHNHPTPPTGNTTTPVYALSMPGSALLCLEIGLPLPTCDQYDNLTATTTLPTAATLHNYDTNQDSLGGRTLPESDDETNCANKVTDPYYERIVWRLPSPTSNDTVNGTVKVRWWWALSSGGVGSSKKMNVYLCNFDTTKAVKNTGGGGGKNPADLVNKETSPNFKLWTQAFDLLATGGGQTIHARVDRQSPSVVKTVSWQLQ